MLRWRVGSGRWVRLHEGVFLTVPGRDDWLTTATAARRRYHDFGYTECGLVVELDGRLGHEQRRDRVRDGQRDRQLLTRERLTTRVFWPDVALTPCDTAAELGSILRGRGWLGRPHQCRRPGCTVPAVSR